MQPEKRAEASPDTILGACHITGGTGMEKMRRKDRELTDREGILRILERAKILRLALFDGDYPYVVPLHYAY